MAFSAGIAIFAIGTAASIRQQKKSRKSREKAERINSKRAALENARKRRAQVAEQRRKRAAAQVSAEGSNTSGASTVSGAIGGIDSTSASNVSFLNQQQGFDQARFAALSEARSSDGKASTFQAAASVGSALSAGGRNKPSK